MNRRLPHSRPTPTLTKGDDLPPGSCALDPYWFDQAAGEAKMGPKRDYAIAEAKAICAGCPLTGADGPCLKQNRNAPGIVAGLTMQQRGAAGRLKPCGTEAAYQRHRRAGEQPCFPCRQANAEHTRAKRERRNAA